MSDAAADLAATLVAHGVGTVYCLPGEETIDLIDALDQAGLRLVVARHEQHAAFMAAAHGRFTGEPGVLVTTLGPGMTNALTGLAHAHLCDFPVVAICGQKPARDNAEGSFQVLDLTRLAEPVTRWAHRVTDPATLGFDTARAYQVATQGRGGPTLLEVPVDVAAGPGVGATGPAETAPPPISPPAAVAAAAEVIRAAERPVVLAGQMAQHAADAVLDFAARTGIGVVATQMGKGTISEYHPASLRTLSLNDGGLAGEPLADADVIITVGYQPVEHPPASFNDDDHASFVHIDLEAPRIERHYAPQLSLVGDPMVTLTGLADLLEGDVLQRRTATTEARLRVERLLAEEKEPTDTWPPTAQTVADALRDVLARTDIVALDNGAYKVWFARHYRSLSPHGVVLDNALATMGAGLATAMVAARRHPDRDVVAVCGDGGFLMNLQDLETAVRLGLPNLTVLVLNDDAYGFIAWHQREQGRKETAVHLDNPDFVGVAEAFGVAAWRAEEAALADTLRRAVAHRGVSLVVSPLDQSRNDDLS